MTRPTPPDTEGAHAADEEWDAASLKGATLQGVRWVAATRVVYEVLAFGSSIVLARLISPAETGLAAIALVIPLLAVVLTFEGFGSALVQRETITAAHERASLGLSLTTGVLLTVVSLVFALTIAPAAFGDRASEFLVVMSFSFILASVSTVPRARLQRRLEFKALSLYDVVSFVVNIGVAIPMAAAGSGGLSLVVGMLAGQTAGSIYLVSRAGLPRPGLHREEAREISRFGIPAAAAGLIYSARRGTPWLVLGASLAPAAVGQFYRAYQLGAEYQAKVSGVMLGVVFPILSRTTDLGEIQALRGRIVRTNALVLVPALGLLIVIAPELVPVMYGPDWAGAVEATQILALVGITLALMSGTEALTLALGHPRALLVFHTTFAVLYLAVLVLSATSGDLVIVAIASVGVHVVMLLFAQAYLVSRLARLPFSELWRDAGPALVSTAVATGAGWLAADALRSIDAPSVVLMFTVAVLGAGMYLASLRVAFATHWREIRMLPSILRRG